jgi:hypothetical protein
LPSKLKALGALGLIPSIGRQGREIGRGRGRGRGREGEREREREKHEGNKVGIDVDLWGSALLQTERTAAVKILRRGLTSHGGIARMSQKGRKWELMRTERFCRL